MNTTAHKLEQLFQIFGQVTDTFILHDRDGNRTGAAVITMSNSAEAKSAVKNLNGTELDGNKITVKLA